MWCAMFKAAVVSGIGVACLLGLSGCVPSLAQGKLADRKVPPSFGGSLDTTSSAQIKWSEFFTEPKLNALIDLALKDNQELNVVTLELDIAKNEIMTREGDFLPKL